MFQIGNGAHYKGKPRPKARLSASAKLKVKGGPAMTSDEIEPVFVYTTVETQDQAEALATSLVERKLAACVNIVPQIRSIYRWRGKLENTTECALFIKSHKRRLDDLLGQAKALHPYDLPVLVVLPLAGGDKDYLAWVAEQTDPGKVDGDALG